MTDPSRHDPDRRMLLAAAVGTTLFTASGAQAADTVAPPVPTLAPAFAIHATLGTPIEFGTVGGVRKRLVPITGGTISGARLSGIVVPGGGDWQDIEPDGTTRILARYTLQAKDGTLIGVTNPGIRRGPPEVLRRLAAGEIVDPSLYYFRTTPTFAVAAGPHAWLGQSIFVGSGIRRATEVELQYFSVA